ncbi:alanine--tRNA ligase [Ruficoccus amylovorans]|uniref:Alanine--tRNA ligase n=1 Tax=Ruficoccus amylovorans TaxID=1804625 RepID=A0A842HKA2_9BACT|nr:alanine--tRNA ligase [Ruficoccus amylovorans]MBC2596378.1 alanine--tRNA ligase [Ruficoccus amylovorans]
MTSAELRQSFLDFFASKGHTVVSSAPLMPSSPNLLFTNAGMNQFVPYFLGEQKAPFKRACDTQKCIRAGGKHNDLDDVGFDTYHHTLFEMLGNWSFGDYFKREAIEWAWELLTRVWGLPRERLYATVYRPDEGDPAEFDQEAYDIWKDVLSADGLDPKLHIRTGNKKDNFWMMGDTGPCGPCSEIHIDLTPKGDSRGELVNADSPQCIEIWNLVFMQFNAEANGTFKPLSAKHVDTGMGFERVAGIFATTDGFKDFTKEPSNYDSDLFGDLFRHISDMSGRTYTGTVPKNRDDLSGQEMTDVIFRVLADHIRTLSFSIADGILPGNEGRNYVLRRILRRAVMFGKRINLPRGFFANLVAPLVTKMAPHFPELADQQEVILKVIRQEEQAFDRTLDRGLQLFDKFTLDGTGITGEQAFILYDTYGFPLDLTQIIARERGLTVDSAGFEAQMEQQRQRARSAQKKDVISVFEEGEKVHSTQFVGYNCSEISHVETTLVGTFEGEEESYLVFAQSPFYAEMGGQVGDTGHAEIGGQRIEILNTITDAAGHVLHKAPKSDAYNKLVSQPAVLSVDTARRRQIQRHHSATHLLDWALREQLGSHIRQAGSLVSPGHLRFDFSHFEALSPEQLHEIEEMINARIIANDPVQWYEIPLEDKPDDVVSVFGEKYGAIVRVVDIGGYSKELCGGTHVRATGELGMFKIVSEAAIAAGTRRIEAVSGQNAIELAGRNFDRLGSLSRKLSCRPDELEERLQVLLDQRSELEKKLRGLEQKQAAAQGGDLLSHAVEKDGIKWIAAPVKVANPNDMRGLAIDLLKKLGEGVVVLGGDFDGKVTVLATCSPEAIKQGHKAGDIVRELTAALGGKGGGKPDFAMGGGKDADQLAPALKALLQ